MPPVLSQCPQSSDQGEILFSWAGVGAKNDTEKSLSINVLKVHLHNCLLPAMGCSGQPSNPSYLSKWSCSHGSSLNYKNSQTSTVIFTRSVPWGNKSKKIWCTIGGDPAEPFGPEHGRAVPGQSWVGSLASWDLSSCIGRAQTLQTL